MGRSNRLNPHAHRFHCVPFALALAVGLGLGVLGCSGDACPTCIEGVDPGKVIDPLSLGDGSGFPGAAWVRAPDPELLGWSGKRLRSVTELARHIGSDGLMVVDRGVVVLEHGSVSRNLIVQSCRKSFLAGLYGIYHDQGLIELEASIGGAGHRRPPPGPHARGETGHGGTASDGPFRGVP